MRMVYTLTDGRMDFDADWGRPDGPRAIDGRAGRVRFAEAARDRPLADFRAVAVVYSERTVRVPGPHDLYVEEPRMVHSVVLVPRDPPPACAALLDAFEAGASPSSGFSLYGSAQDLAATSLLVGLAPAGTARDAAKAAARLARLPMLELYGEFPVWRPRDRLDLSLRDLPPGAPRPGDPGPTPAGIVATSAEGELRIREASASRTPLRSRNVLLALAAASAAAAVALLFVVVPAAVVAALLAAASLFAALAGRGAAGRRLVVGPAVLRWEGSDAADEIAVDEVEMLRVADSTLVVVGRNDEVRCEFGDPAIASWVRAATLHHLLPPTRVPE